jgi:hypothetical protein
MTTRLVHATATATLAMALAASAFAESPAPLMDSSAPVIADLHALAGARLNFSLSEYAVVRVVIYHRSTVAARMSHVFGVGRASLRVGRVGHTRLRHGWYVARVTAVDAARNRSRAYNVRFQVAR